MAASTRDDSDFAFVCGLVRRIGDDFAKAGVAELLAAELARLFHAKPAPGGAVRIGALLKAYEDVAALALMSGAEAVGRAPRRPKDVSSA